MGFFFGTSASMLCFFMLQDAHEFLDHILDQLKDEVNVLSKCSESIDCGGCGKGGDYASPSTEAGSSGDSVSKYDPAGCNFMLDIVTRYECQRLVILVNVNFTE